MEQPSVVPAFLFVMTGIAHVAFALLSSNLSSHLFPKDRPLIGIWSLEKAADGTVIGGWETFGAAWFIIGGPFMMLLGYMMHMYIKDTQRCLPALLGWALIVLGLIGCVAFPVSGFWLVWPQGCWIVFIASQRIQKKQC